MLQLPAALRAIPAWVCWEAVPNPKRAKPDKPPVDAKTGQLAKSDDPNTWSPFATALAALEKNPKLSGVGFETSLEDPFTFVDLDDCRDPATGDLGDWAREIIEKLNSYAEVSPSGTGVRVIVEAKLSPTHANRRGKVEVYSHSQYLTLTGDHLAGTPKAIGKRQAELADLYQLVFGKAEKVTAPAAPPFDPKLARVQAISDDDLLARAVAAANGVKFAKLWAGDLSDYNGDHSTADAALCSLLTYWTRADRGRVDRLFRRSKLLRPKWDSRRGGDTYGTNTIEFAIRGATVLYDPDLDQQLQEGHNDIANTEVFILLHDSEFLWAVEAKSWLCWNCHHWEPFADLKVLRAAEDVSAELLRRANASPDPDPKVQAKRIKWAVTSGDLRRRDAIVNYARSRAPVTSDQLDRNPYLLCCANGVVDLETGELRDGTRADRLVRSTEIAYDPDAKCPTWDRFLKEIMESDREMVAYLWRVFGYALTGDVTERAFWLFHGEGRNGKSTFVETLKAALGPPGTGYAQKARFSTFLRKNIAGGANDDVAHLAGARAVVASEADERMPLDVALVKELTGGDTHRARFLYGREFEFTPQFKLFLVTNKVPPIHETTYAIWDRLHYVEFDWRVPEDKVDRRLPLKLLGELPGILARAVQACLEWQREGLKPPEKVLKAGKKLYGEMDTFGEFMVECVEVKTEKSVETHKDIYNCFLWWARQQGINRPASSKALAAYLREKKFIEFRGTDHVKSWSGLKLNTTAAKKSSYDGGL